MQERGPLENLQEQQIMAITAEDIQRTIAGADGEITDTVRETADNLFKMISADVAGLKNTNAELKAEKKTLQDKMVADQEKFSETEKSLQSQIASYQEQLKNQDPEQSKKFFDNQLEILKQGYDAQLAEKTKSIAELTATIDGYKKKDLYNDMVKEFRKAADKNNVAPETMSVVENWILGDGGRNFAPIDTDAGRLFLSVDKSGDDIATRLDKFLKTPAGSRFKLFNSSGAGAEGGSRTGSAAGKTMSRAEFNALPPQKKVEAAREGWKITD